MDAELSITKLLLSRFEKYFLAEVKFFFFPPLFDDQNQNLKFLRHVHPYYDWNI